MNRQRFLFLTGMVLVAALTRLIPHPSNFAPIAALALFGGAEFGPKREAFIVPLAAMFLSDSILGLHSLIPLIYGTFALIVGMGFYLRNRQNVWTITGMSVAGAILFFAVTNLGVWASGIFHPIYPMTLPGLLQCYLAAIPFFWNTLLSDLLYAALLFGGLALAEKQWPILAEAVPA
jgi:hypothetical protein